MLMPVRWPDWPRPTTVSDQRGPGNLVGQRCHHYLRGSTARPEKAVENSAEKSGPVPDRTLLNQCITPGSKRFFTHAVKTITDTGARRST